jgi:heptosyltransferase-3
MSYGDYPDLKGVQKILVIKLRQLGDVLLTGPVFNTLRRRFEGAEIHAYVYIEAFPMLEGHPGVDQLIGYDRGWKKRGLWKRVKEEWRLWRKLRKGGYDLVINLTEGDRGALAARASKAGVRVGFQPKGRWQKGLYTHVVKHCPSLRHTVERNLDALRRIGIFPEWEERELFLKVPESKIQGPYVVIHPTSRWRFKSLPVEKMRELAEELIRRGKRLVFTSGPEPTEIEMVKEITRGLDVIDLSGQISLKELGGLIGGSEFLVCVDSVPFHMANALKKEVVAIFGPTSEVTWGPWRNEGARIVAQNLSCRPCYQDGCGGSKRSDCLATLPVEAILGAIQTLPQSLKSSPK